MKSNDILNYFTEEDYVNITIEKERAFWNNYLLKTIIIIPIICIRCGNNGINVTDNNTLINPLVARCTRASCRKIYYLRENTFLSNFPKTPASLVMLILREWIIEEKNGKEIYEFLKKEKINYNISQINIYEILSLARYYISHYYKDKYKIEEFSTENGNQAYGIDESLFIHNDNSGIWLIGIINNQTKNFRLEISELRNTAVLKKIIYYHIKRGNKIVTDGWGGYNFLSNIDSPYEHSVHNHGHGDFGGRYRFNKPYRIYMVTNESSYKKNLLYYS